MSKVVWDNTHVEAGLDHGTLYLPDGRVLPWNGLISISEQTENAGSARYLDGIKYLDDQARGSFSAKVVAFTYPAELEEFVGYEIVHAGLLAHAQRLKTFSFVFRTKVVDSSGGDIGYKLHVVYDAYALPDIETHKTLDARAEAELFSWAMKTKAKEFVGHAPTAYVVVDSTKVSATFLELIENKLFGTETTAPVLLSPPYLLSLVAGRIVIEDLGNGLWRATAEGDEIVALDSTTFQINDVDATYLDADTYEVSTTHY